MAEARREYQITAEFPDDKFPERTVEPGGIVTESIDDACAAVRRALEQHRGIVLIVSSELTDEPRVGEDPDLDDWPAIRHVRSERKAS